MSHPDQLVPFAEATAQAWRLDRGQIVDLQEQVRTLAADRAELSGKLAAAEDLADKLEGALTEEEAAHAQTAAELTAATQRVEALQAQVEELRRRLAAHEPPSTAWERLELVVCGPEPPSPGTLVTVATVLPESFRAEQVIVTSGELHLPVEHQVDVLNRWPSGGARHVLVTVPYEPEADLYLGPALAIARAPFVPGLPSGIAVEISIHLADNEREERVVFVPTDPAAYELRIAGPLLWEGRWRCRVESRLEVILDLRCYRGEQWSADVILANVDSQVATPITYDVAVRRAGGGAFWERAGIVQWHHSKVLATVNPWGAHQVAARCPAGEWAEWGLLPRYGPVEVTEEGLVKLAQALETAEANPDPMSSGLVRRVMGAQGGRGDIGPLPAWTALALLSGDPRAYRAMMHCAGRSLPWPIHYFDYTNLEPYSILRHPTGTTVNVKDGVRPEDVVAVGPEVALRPDHAHTPSLCYLPWMVTGRRIWLDELEDWMSWKNLAQNHKYRGGSVGLLKAREEARAQAWDLRDLLTLWLALPDSRTGRREEALAQLRANAVWYRDVAAKTNTLGRWGLSTYNLSDFDKTQVGAHDRPWQNSFLVMIAGWCVRTGLEEWRPAAEWFARYTVGLFDHLTPEQATAYHLAATRPGPGATSSQAATWIVNWQEIVALTPADAANWRPDWADHWQAQAVGALAVAADLGLPGARERHAWLWGETVAAFPARYGEAPTFALVPAPA